MPALAPSHKRLCNLSSKPFFAIVAYHLGQKALIGAGQEVRGTLAAGGVHAHVQRRVEAEAEPARGVVDLRRAHAQVQQHALHPREALAGEHLGHLREVGVMDGKTRVLDPRGTLCRRGHRLRVAVEGDQPPRRRQARQQQPRVTPATEGAVHVDAVGRRHQRVDRFVQQDGGVRPCRFVHPALTSRCRAARRAGRRPARWLHARRDGSCPRARISNPCR